MSTFSDGVYQFGGSPVGPAASVISAGGKWLWVDPVSGDDSKDGKSPKRAMKTVRAAEDLLTANRHDGLFLIGGASAITETASIGWDKSYTHMIGLTPPTMYGIRNRVLTSTIDISPVITISANGCVFQNVMFSNEGDDAHNLIGATVTGARNYFGNVTFRVIGATAVTATGKRDIKLNSTDGENYFYKCTFGTDTYDGSANAANYNMEFTASAETARNIFDSCLWLGSGSSGAAWIIAGASSMSSFQLVSNCLFYNNLHGSMNEMTQGFNLNAACGGELVFKNTSYYGCATLETTNSSMILGDEVNAAGTTGKLLALTF